MACTAADEVEGRHTGKLQVKVQDTTDSIKLASCRPSGRMPNWQAGKLQMKLHDAIGVSWEAADEATRCHIGKLATTHKSSNTLEQQVMLLWSLVPMLTQSKEFGS